jgi:hypothetical protein
MAAWRSRAFIFNGLLLAGLLCICANICRQNARMPKADRLRHA